MKKSRKGKLLMKTNVTDTSLDAFYSVKTTPVLQDQQRKILSVMQPGMAYTRRQLAMLSGVEISTVSARVNSLLDIKIEVIGRTKDPVTNKTVQALQLKAA